MPQNPTAAKSDEGDAKGGGEVGDQDQQLRQRNVEVVGVGVEGNAATDRRREPGDGQQSVAQREEVACEQIGHVVRVVVAYRGASAGKEAAEDQVVQADEKSTDEPGEQDLAPLAEAE